MITRILNILTVPFENQALQILTIINTLSLISLITYELYTV